MSQTEAAVISGLVRDLDRLRCRPIVVASHPRSGTHLFIDSLRLNFAECASRKAWFAPVDGLYASIDALGEGKNLRRLSARLLRTLARTARPLIKTHALCDLQRIVGQKDTVIPSELSRWLRDHSTRVYMFRDGRDVMCSYHRYMATYAPEARVGVSEFLRQRIDGMSRPKAWAFHVRDWLADAQAYAVRMEDLLNRFSAVMQSFAAKVGLTVVPADVTRPPRDGSCWRSRLRRRIVPFPRSTAILAGPSASPPNWRVDFTQADREFFHQEAGDMLVKLGYEHSDGWVSRGWMDDSKIKPTRLWGLSHVSALLRCDMDFSLLILVGEACLIGW